MISRLLRRTAAVSVASLGAYLLFLRPRHLRWGASDAEVCCRYPGDDLVAWPNYTSTRAITVRAPVKQVWPWLAQMGYGRAGFYSYDWLERAIGLRGLSSADGVIDELQDVKPGDSIFLGPGFDIPVKYVEPNHVLVLGYRDWEDADSNPWLHQVARAVSWATVLEEVNDLRTRMIMRTRYQFKATPWGIFFRSILDFGEFIMMRRQLLGIKERVERVRSARARASVEGGLYQDQYP